MQLQAEAVVEAKAREPHRLSTLGAEASRSLQWVREGPSEESF